ncbi:MAG: hypothetical protein AAGK97_11655, partial [Bacteroidota bacterium]
MKYKKNITSIFILIGLLLSSMYLHGFSYADSTLVDNPVPISTIATPTIIHSEHNALPERFLTSGKSETEIKEEVKEAFTKKMTASFPELDKLIQEKLSELDEQNARQRDYNEVIDGSNTIILDATTNGDEFTDMNGYDFKNDQQIQNVAKAKEVLKKIK